MSRVVIGPDKSRHRICPVLELQMSGKCVNQELGPTAIDNQSQWEHTARHTTFCLGVIGVCCSNTSDWRAGYSVETANSSRNSHFHIPAALAAKRNFRVSQLNCSAVQNVGDTP